MKKTTKSLLITSLILFCSGLLLALSSALFVKLKGIDAYGVAPVEKTIETKTLSLDDILEASPECNFINKLSNKEFLRVDIGSFTGKVIVRSAEETSVELFDANTSNLSCKIVGETLTICENAPVGIMGLFIDNNGFSFKGLRQIFGPGNSANRDKVVILNLAEDFPVDRITIKSHLGDVDIYGISADEINVSSFAGDVSFGDLSNENAKITLKSDFGDVNLKNSEYASCSLNLKFGDISAQILDEENVSTVLEAWLGNIKIETIVPTESFKLTLSTTLGGIRKNGENIGKSVRESTDSTSRITASTMMGDISVNHDTEGADEVSEEQTESEFVTETNTQTEEALETKTTE